MMTTLFTQITGYPGIQYPGVHLIEIVFTGTQQLDVKKKNAHLKKFSSFKLLISSLDQKISQQIFTEHAKNDGKNWPGRKYVLNKYLLQKSTEPVFLLKWIKKYLRCVLISRCLCKLRLL